jgi:hypothetical protein
MFFTRPRMTVTTYAYDNGETNELYVGNYVYYYSPQKIMFQKKKHEMRETILLYCTVSWSSFMISMIYVCAEYHLGRAAYRVCKIGTKFCAWHNELPPFYTWRHMCIVSSGHVTACCHHFTHDAACA